MTTEKGLDGNARTGTPKPERFVQTQFSTRNPSKLSEMYSKSIFE